VVKLRLKKHLPKIKTVMINIEEARAIIQKTVRDFGTTTVDLDEAVGRVLREDFYADRDFPPYHRVTMDGIALVAESFEAGKVYPIEGVAAAGAPQQKLSSRDACLEVMTGAILPEGCNAVIRYEDLLIKEDTVRVQLEKINSGQNIHNKGEDRLQGDLVVRGGRILSPAEIGVAATIGKAKIKVSQLPKTTIISTGDELVTVDQKPLPYQIRRSNVHRLKATLRNFNIDAETQHLVDDLDIVTSRLEKIITQNELLLLSGGVSKGKFDYLPQALENLGVKKLFHKIKQRPGKPFWFGEAPNGTIIFALPGNPVSSFMCTQIYLYPWLWDCLGLPAAPPPFGILQKPIHFKPDLTYFAQVKVDYNAEGQILATLVEGNGSGDLANLVDADAFIELPRGKDLFEAGEVYPLHFYR
jgi:molybdopterin molybdotransferase